MRPGRAPLLVLAAACLAAGEAVAQERVLLRRYADVVAVRPADDVPEEVLYYFDPTRELPQGAQVQQGSGGFTELHLSGGAVIASHASTHMVLERLDPKGDIVRFPVLNLLEVVGGTRTLELVLPGDTRCMLLGSSLLIELVPGRLRIRNQKGEAVLVTGLIGVTPTPAGAAAGAEPGQGRVLLAAGREIQIPLYAGERSGDALTARRWVGRLVRRGPGAVLTLDGARLEVGRDGDGDLHAEAPVEVGGVSTRPGTGRLVVRDPRPMALPEQPTPPVEPPPAGTPPTEPASKPPPVGPAATADDGAEPSPEEDSP